MIVRIPVILTASQLATRRETSMDVPDLGSLSWLEHTHAIAK